MPAKIDILIPAIEKDLGTLPYVIDSVRKHVKHPIGRFLIVSPPGSDKIRRLCARKGCTFVNENTVLPIGKSQIKYSSSRWNRSGWLYQQLLKLNGDRLCTNDHYLVIDADTVLIRPHVFLTPEGRTVFYCRSWSQPEYFRTYRKLLGHKPPRPTSFVTHYMLFNRAKVAQLKLAFASRHNTSWYRAILQSINKKKQFAFSEFETYGNFLYANSPRRVVLRKALNKSLPLNASRLTAAKRRKLALSFRSLSFHKRKDYSRKM